jgi:hypothetical protein
MGGGNWSTDVYASTTGATLRSGKSGFEYTDTTRSRGMTEWKAHETLDPKSVNNNGVHAGDNIRESMDLPEHPKSVAVAVLFDVTGSMGEIPETLLKKLPALLGLVQMKGYVEDPQIMFGAVGDATSDRVPLQMAQFEADNRMDEHLKNIFIEGNGGGWGYESYELGMYYLARKTYIECFEKRQHKGYAFIIGDEAPYPQVKAREVRRVIGDEITDNIPTTDILAELQEKYEVYVLIPATDSGSQDAIIKAWQGLLGQNVILLDDRGESVAEVIAVTVGLAEEAIELSEGLEHLREHETEDVTIKAVEAALTR